MKYTEKQVAEIAKSYGDLIRKFARLSLSGFKKYSVAKEILEKEIPRYRRTVPKSIQKSFELDGLDLSEIERICRMF